MIIIIFLFKIEKKIILKNKIHQYGIFIDSQNETLCYKILNSWELRVTLPKFYCSSGKIIKHNKKIRKNKKRDSKKRNSIHSVHQQFHKFTLRKLIFE